MKKVLLGFIISLTVLNSNAQKNNDSKIAFNVGGEVALTTGGSLKTNYSVGLGATAQLEYAVDDKLSITANSGLIQYVGRKTTIAGIPVKIRNTATFPILVGAKYNLSTNFYGSIQLGSSIFSGAGQTSKFTYVPSLGFKANEKYDVQIKYTGYVNYGGAFGVRVSYSL
jgi:hypothetical protein